MESDNDNHIEPEHVGYSVGNVANEGSSVPHQPMTSDATVQTQGGAYIAGSITNQGGISILGGKVDTIIYQGPIPAPPKASTRPETYIPFQSSSHFQPRPGEFEELERLLFEAVRGPTRLGLVGMGGVGKSRLSIELALRCVAQQRYPAGVFWTPCPGQKASDWQRQLAALAQDTDYLPPDDNLSSPENEERRARYFCRYLARHSDALLILDNLEDPELINSALPALAGGEVLCSVLYTSRISSPPDGVMIYSVEQLSEEGALRLLLQETRPVLLSHIEEGQIDTEAKAAHDVCRAVGNLPLALINLRGLLKKDQHLTLLRLYGVLAQRGVLNLVQALASTLDLSWEKVQGEEARRLFKLACYFPEAVPIPLWLLGLAANLGEHGDILEPLGEARFELQELSLLEELPNELVQLHPLVRTFGQRLVSADSEKGQALLQEAADRLTAEFTHLNQLEQRARDQGYWRGLEQVRAVRQYIKLLGATKQAEQVERIEHWLDRESYLLGDEQWWPTAIPGLFYQQLSNRAIEEGHPLAAGAVSARWVRQEGCVGAEDQPLLRRFSGHSSAVTSMVFSPEGSKVLTGSADTTARLWETASGKLLAILKGHTGDVASVAFSPDGTSMLTGSEDGTVRLWETASGKLLSTLEGSLDKVASVAVSPDGTRVLMGSWDGKVWLREITGGMLLTQLDQADALISVALSPDGSKILAGSLLEGNAGLWETASGKLLIKLKGHSDLVKSVAFSPNGSEMLTGSWDGKARLWETASGTLLFTLEGHSDKVMCVTFSPDGSKVLTGSLDKTALLWETASGKLLTKLEGHSGQIMSVAFTPDGSQMLTGSNDWTARLWEIASRQELPKSESHSGYVRGMAFSPDGTRMLTGSSDKKARLWETASGKLLTTLEDHTDEVWSVAFSPDGSKVLTGSLDKKARLWEAASRKLLIVLEGHTDWVWSVAFSPDGSKVLTGSKDTTARLWETGSGKLLRTLEGHTGDVEVVAFSPDGSKVLTGSNDTTARLWETDSGKLLRTLEGHTSSVKSLAFSPDGARMLTGSWDKTARLWETGSGKPLAVLPDHLGGVTKIAFSPGGYLVMTCTGNGYMFLWQTGAAEMGSLQGMYSTLYEVGAVHWQDRTTLVLADMGGSRGSHHFYRLKLEGPW